MRDLSSTQRNIALYPWFRFFQSLIFWQAVWFLYFQSRLSAAEAILLYAIYDVATTVLEVPSGYMSDRIGRRFTLVTAGIAGLCGVILLAMGDSFAAFAAAQVLIGAGTAFASGTDSALLYESLVAEDRADETERQELRAWRFSFSALAISAVSGGALSLLSPVLPFIASGVALAVMLLISIRLSEPPSTDLALPQGGEFARLRRLGTAFTDPVLRWLFVLSVLMYGYSHIPFVFGQPFIQEALAGAGLAPEAPLVSGIVSTTMMVLSVGTSLLAPGLRTRIGLAGILCLAFGMQIMLIAAMAISSSLPVIALLFLRMVPDSLSRPFIQARIQPMLRNESRATFLSLQSFVGRLLFATSLVLASRATGGGEMAYSEIQTVLGAYAVVGACLLAVLLVTLPRAGLSRPRH